MSDWLRRLKGAIGMGITWAVAWIPIGILVALGLWLGLSLDPPSVLRFLIRYAAVFGILGFVGGGLFSGVLSLTEGKRRFDELSLPRFAGWGAVGGLVLGGLGVFAGLWGGMGTAGLIVIASATVLGSLSAAGTLAVARQAEGGSELGSGGAADEIGRSGEETQTLSGPTG